MHPFFSKISPSRGMNLIRVFSMLLALLILSACGDKVSEQQVSQQVEEQIKSLSPLLEIAVKEIKPDLQNSGVTLTGMSIKPTAGPGCRADWVIHVKEALITGIDVATYSGSPGDMSSYASIIFNDISIDLDNGASVQIANYKLGNVSTPMRAINRAFADYTGDKDQLLTALTLLYAKNTIGTHTLSAGELRYDGAILSWDGFTGSDSGLLGKGPGEISHIKLQYLDNSVLEAESISWDKMAFPTSLGRFLLSGNQADLPFFTDKTALSVWDGLQIDNLQLNGWYASENGHTFIKGEKNTLSLDISEKNGISIALSGKGTSIPSEVWAQNHLLLLQIHSGPLLMDSSITLATSNLDADGKSDINLALSAHEKDLGGAELKAKGQVAVNQDIFKAFQTFALSEASLEVKNSGWMDLFIQSSYQHLPFNVVYVDQLDEWEEIKNESSSPTEKLLISAFMELMAQGGVLLVESKPETPMLLISPESGGNMVDKMGIKTTFTAPKTPLPRPYAIRE